jgi:glutamate-1-semialdehyde aminotransferase
MGGAQEYFGVFPDLACYSKAIANGMPISVLCGRGEIMHLLDEDVFFFTTFGGEALSLVAAVRTIHELRDKRVPRHLANQGLKLKDGYNQIAKELDLERFTECIGHPSRSLITFDPSMGDPLLMKSLVQQELIKRGVLWSGFHNMSFSHGDEDIEHILNAYREVLSFLKGAKMDDMVEDLLRGKPVQPVFRKTTETKMETEQGKSVPSLMKETSG